MLPTLYRRAPVDTIEAPLSAFESETQAVIQRTSPYSEHAVLHLIAGIIVLSLILMSVVRLDRIVTGTGMIIPTEGSLFVNPLDREIVSAILVKRGELVKKGQALAKLDPTFTTADFEQLQQKLASAQALVQRLQTEADGKFYHPGSTPFEQLQLTIWNQRQTEYRQSVANYDAQIGSTMAQVQKAKSDVVNDKQHLSLTGEMARMQGDLDKQGWGSRALVVTAEDNRVLAARQLGESQNTIVQGEQDAQSLRAQRANYIGKWRDDLNTALVQAKTDRDAAQDAFTRAAKMHELSVITAPVDAVVVSIGSASVGSIVDPSLSTQPLFTLTPLSGPLEAEIDVQSQDVGFIRKGDPVSLKLDAFTYIEHGSAEGRIKSISEGSFTTSDSGQTVPAFFKVRVQITKLHLRNVPKSMRLIPGMTLTGDARVGGRTIMSYMVEGALRTGSEAMREP